MQPESSDGFASVGTILPEEGAALLPGGSFRFLAGNLSRHALEVTHNICVPWFAWPVSTSSLVSLELDNAVK
jgi:hypothetical protein